MYEMQLLLAIKISSLLRFEPWVPYFRMVYFTTGLTNVNLELIKHVYEKHLFYL